MQSSLFHVYMPIIYGILIVQFLVHKALGFYFSRLLHKKTAQHGLKHGATGTTVSEKVNARTHHTGDAGMYLMYRLVILPTKITTRHIQTIPAAPLKPLQAR